VAHAPHSPNRGATTDAATGGVDQPLAPVPPPDLAERRLPILTMPPTPWYRGHNARHPPLHFNPRRGRFTPPAGNVGVLYVGVDARGAFVEAFCHDETRRDVEEVTLRASCLCPVQPTRPFRLVDLSAARALRRLGADNRVCDGPHALSRWWAAALWAHPDRPDGIYYRSRLAPELFSVALFEDRAADALRADCVGNCQADCPSNLLAVPSELDPILDYLEIALV
jgi:hypothetical protein